jgi:hypothetical protein
MLKESKEQMLFVRYCGLKGIPCVFIPNGFPLLGMKNKYAFINSLKAQGYSKGFPDLMILAHNSTKDILFIEFKRVRGGKLSKEQEEWQDKLWSLGYDSFVANGAREAIQILEDWLRQ